MQQQAVPALAKHNTSPGAEAGRGGSGVNVEAEVETNKEGSESDKVTTGSVVSFFFSSSSDAGEEGQDAHAQTDTTSVAAAPATVAETLWLGATDQSI